MKSKESFSCDGWAFCLIQCENDESKRTDGFCRQIETCQTYQTNSGSFSSLSVNSPTDLLTVRFYRQRGQTTEKVSRGHGSMEGMSSWVAHATMTRVHLISRRHVRFDLTVIAFVLCQNIPSSDQTNLSTFCPNQSCFVPSSSFCFTFMRSHLISYGRTASKPNSEDKKKMSNWTGKN